jgi:outer membrane immunogenic protein
MICNMRNSGAATHGGRRVAGLARRASRWRVLLAALGLMLLQPAIAAADDDLDFSALRGSMSNSFAKPSYSRWDGVYFGAQLGMSSGTMDYSNSLSSLTGFILRNHILQDEVTSWTIMGRESSSHTSYGAFIGYNLNRWEQVVLSLEATYSYVNLNSSTAGSISRSILNDTQAPTGHHFYYDTTVSGSASVRVTDIATLRARAGWQTGQFLPYAFGGLAIGRASFARSATVSYTTEDKPDPAIPPTTPTPPAAMAAVTQAESQSSSIAYGFTAGLGVDVSILPNVFLRAEWEYVQFAPIHDIQVNINTGRVGIGMKF